jgi:alkanesulfonate monooxygenase SsuD/methylene tetrahydromethanopterin reductase-like flavin-dependent oxidoreductase (luciferase family)
LVTPLSRRRVHKLARETVTLDHLSGGRLTLGVGLGSSRSGEIERFGEVADPLERARLLDDGLRQLNEYWNGDLEPVPVQRPRIPIWVASRWPNRKPLRRAAQWDGLFPIELPDPASLATLVAEVHELRPADAGNFDVVAEIPPGGDAAPWHEAGATWILTAFGSEPREREVTAVIDAGPRA